MKLPRFSLRDLFWLVLVCALAVGWGVDRVRISQKERALDEQTEHLMQWESDITEEYKAIRQYMASPNRPRYQRPPGGLQPSSDTAAP